MEQASINPPVTIKDMMAFTLIEIFPLKEPLASIKSIMSDWKKRKGMLLEYSKTRHYIFFDSNNACIRVMPMSFDGGFMPHERMMKAFPFGFDIQTQLINNVEYTLFVDIDESIKQEAIFSYKGVNYNNVAFIGQQFNYSIAPLKLSEVINFLSNVDISLEYECVMVYPPA